MDLRILANRFDGSPASSPGYHAVEFTSRPFCAPRTFRFPFAGESWKVIIERHEGTSPRCRNYTLFELKLKPGEFAKLPLAVFKRDRIWFIPILLLHCLFLGGGYREVFVLGDIIFLFLFYGWYFSCLLDEIVWLWYCWWSLFFKIGRIYTIKSNRDKVYTKKDLKRAIREEAPLTKPVQYTIYNMTFNYHIRGIRRQKSTDQGSTAIHCTKKPPQW